MDNIKEKDIILVKVTGIQSYGVFVTTSDNQEGLIHISEISYGFVKNVNDYIKTGDEIYAEVISIDDETNHLKLSIKDIDFKHDGSKLKRMAETVEGFNPLKEHLEIWINEKIKEIMNKM